MTRVTLFEADGLITGFRCEGHAGDAPEGENLVCAAISCLSTACANALKSVAGVSPRVKVKDGYMDVSIAPADSTRDAQVIFAVFKQGARDIERAYPKLIHIQQSERRKDHD